MIGDLSASLPDYNCNNNFGTTFYGKFADSYYWQAVKNTLNPPNKYGIDDDGIPGRQITCYPQINLNVELNNGTTPPSFFFSLYPANLYQQDNVITLSTSSIDEANFIFQAGQV
jgi:hypothetical protein